MPLRRLEFLVLRPLAIRDQSGEVGAVQPRDLGRLCRGEQFIVGGLLPGHDSTLQRPGKPCRPGV